MKIRLLDSRVEPRLATDGSCAIDLQARIDEPLRLFPGQSERIGTGIALDMTDTYMGALVLPRSGLGSRGIVLGNLVGLIDNDYQGEILVSLWNRSDHPYTIQPLDRVAQLTFVPFIKPVLHFVEEFSSATFRGANGFGSTGD